MKKVIIILICLPSLIFGQTPVDCVQGDCYSEKSIKRYENRLYEGDFKNGKAVGNGYCTWDTGDIYEGYWKNDRVSGEGTMEYSNGTKYIGTWENGTRNGFGTYIWTDGHKFIGEWKQGVKYGEGIQTDPDSYTGFGCKVQDHKKTSKILTDKIITQVYAGSPAEIAGLLVGDVILTVNKLHYNEWVKEESSKKIDKKHKFYIKSGKEKAKSIKIRIAKVSKKNSHDLMSYDGEWIEGKFDGIGTAIYYNQDKKIGVWNDAKFIKSLVIEDRIKEMVESEINEWQKKGEFEKTITYQARVMDKNRDRKVKELESIALQNLKSEFCESVDWSIIELSKYDADNEAFIIKGGRYLPNYYNKYYPLGDLVISIPQDTAQYFKANFGSFKFQNLDCVTSDDNFILSYVELCGKDQLKSVWYVDSTFNSWDSTYYVSRKEKRYYEHSVYAYSSDDAHDYIFTEMEYSFADIKIDEVADAMINNKSVISRKNLNVGTSAVNKDIPIKDELDHRYALIIGNEDYESKQTGLSAEQNVDYAINDASIFKEYALNTFGVKEENMIYLFDATSVEMSRAINKISKLISIKSKESELIVYYAGHGHPEENTHVPYLFPVDVNANDFIGAIKLDDIYRDLSATGAKKIIIFLDACFTGGARGDGLMASSRGITVEPEEEVLSGGNLLIFSASSGKESSLAYENEEHGMFTYYLLKKLQESDGNVSMGELADYLQDNVPLESLKINGRKQNPAIRFSPGVESNWRNWKF